MNQLMSFPVGICPSTKKEARTFLWRSFVCFLAVLLCVSFVSLQVYAAGQEWRILFSGFQQLSIASKNTYKDYTIALQLCLSDFDSVYWKLLKAGGGIDGYFGDATRNALIKFQSDKGLSPDGVCGPNTWSKVAELLTVVIYGNGYAYFYYDNVNMFQSTSKAPYEVRYYYTTQGGDTRLSEVFHTAYSLG